MPAIARASGRAQLRVPLDSLAQVDVSLALLAATIERCQLTSKRAKRMKVEDDGLEMIRVHLAKVNQLMNAKQQHGRRPKDEVPQGFIGG